MLHHFGTRMDVCDGQERSLAAIALGASYLCGAFDVFCGEEETQGDEEQDDEDDEEDGDRGARYHCVWLDVCVWLLRVDYMNLGKETANECREGDEAGMLGEGADAEGQKNEDLLQSEGTCGRQRHGRLRCEYVRRKRV